MERYLIDELSKNLKDVEDLRLRYVEGKEVKDEDTIKVLGDMIDTVKSILDEEGQVGVDLELLGRTHLEEDVSTEMEEEYFTSPVEKEQEYEFTKDTENDEEIVEVTREIESDGYNGYEKSNIEMTEETVVQVDTYNNSVEETKKENKLKSGENVGGASKERNGFLEKIKNFFVG